jgi:hypothetical protein
VRTKLTWHGLKVAAATRAAAEQGVGNAAEHLLGVSRERVPLEEGTLERSGRTDQEGLRAAVSYDTVYARRQHEELTWRHDPGRTAKYLENSLREEAATLNGLIGAAIRRALR